MGNSIYQQIQNQYGQQGVDYITFRYHQRRAYKQIKELISIIKRQATLQQNQALHLINQLKHKLLLQFQTAIKDAELLNPGCIKSAQSKSKQKVQQSSGFDQQSTRLDIIYKETDNKYEQKKVTVQKKIRQEIMRKQNQSKLRTIKQFDNKSDRARKKIEEECMKRYPENAESIDLSWIQNRISWQNYRQHFASIFNRQKILAEADSGRNSVKGSILPSNSKLCC